MPEKPTVPSRPVQESALTQRANAFDLLTFDCYGTLIDWNTGICRALTAVLNATGAGTPIALSEALAEYHRLEPAIQAGAYRSYRQILDTAAAQVVERFGLRLPPAQRTLLSDSLGGWKPFADTNPALERLKGKYRLGILSNIDRDLLAQTARHFTVPFDVVVTAEDVRSYKPAPGHFVRMRAQLPDGGARWLHVAQSLHHDCVPCKALGIPCVWINRLGETNTLDAEPVAEFAHLTELADALKC